MLAATRARENERVHARWKERTYEGLKMDFRNVISQQGNEARACLCVHVCDRTSNINQKRTNKKARRR